MISFLASLSILALREREKLFEYGSSHRFCLHKIFNHFLAYTYIKIGTIPFYVTIKTEKKKKRASLPTSSCSMLAIPFQNLILVTVEYGSYNDRINNYIKENINLGI